jgi:hypothetical protein
MGFLHSNIIMEIPLNVIITQLSIQAIIATTIFLPLIIMTIDMEVPLKVIMTHCIDIKHHIKAT